MFMQNIFKLKMSNLMELQSKERFLLTVQILAIDCFLNNSIKRIFCA